MADSENDNLENKNNNKYDDKFSCYNFDNNTMHTMYLKNSEIDKVKIEKTEDYYNLFVSILKTDTSVTRLYPQTCVHWERLKV